MYSQNGTTYTEEHSISFGSSLMTYTVENETKEKLKVENNTWNNWYLIPSSRPTIAPAPPVTKYIEIPGRDGVEDLTDFLTANTVYGQRTGSLSFIVDNDHEHWMGLRDKITNYLHGKKRLMVLEDDPKFYYEGRFQVANWESGADHSTITISYQLEPYKRAFDEEGAGHPVIWDTFCFDTDYDYGLQVEHLGAGSHTIEVGAGAFIPTATITSGNGGARITYRGYQTVDLTQGHSFTFDKSKESRATFIISVLDGYRSCAVDITWKKVAL